MAPKKLDYVQQQKRLQERADSMAHKHDLSTCTKLIKDSPHTLYLMKQYLKAKGMWPGEDGSIASGSAEALLPLADEPATPKLKAICDAELQASPSSAPASSPASAKGKGDKFDTIEIHRNFKTWANCPPVHLRMLYGKLEPISCTFGNIKQSFTGNQRELPRPLALELLEFVTGLNPVCEIGETRKLTDILEQWRDLSNKRSRPARDLQFPVHWPSAGIYKLTSECGKLYIECKTKGGARKQILDCKLASANITDLWIQFNYSDANAIIRHTGDSFVREMCACYFFEPLCCQDSPKKRRLNGKGSEARESPSKQRSQPDEADDQQSMPEVPEQVPSQALEQAQVVYPFNLFGLHALSCCPLDIHSLLPPTACMSAPPVRPIGWLASFASEATAQPLHLHLLS
jgi:hypothetical protein